MLEKTQSKKESLCTISTILSLCSEEEARLITENQNELTFNAGEVIVRQGSFISQYVFVKSGLLKVVLEGRNEKNTLLQFINKNKFVGLSIVGNPNTYPFTIAAVVDSKVCFVRHDILSRIMKQNLRVNELLLKNLADEHKFLYQKIDTLSNRNNHGKLASAIMYITNGDFNIDILNRISRKELAELAGISLESLNKILSDLRHEKVIEINDKKITINKPDLIKTLSTVG